MEANATTAGQRTFELAPYSYREVRELVDGLGLAEPVAVTLVRRGFRTVTAARAFLDAGEEHDAAEFEGIDDAIAVLRGAIDTGERITVFGDYDCDGVTATTILVGALRDEGADCDWFIPDRAADGYGLSNEAIASLAERGTRTLITVDCGITAAGEVDAAIQLGLNVVITDHHQPPDQLPDCPIVHPLVSGYPCPDLCAAGVAYKVAAALSGPERADRDLDLVAMATVADMVPLRGENRALVRRGLEHARRGLRPGLLALMRAASISPERLDEGDFAFRLAPRINAAGRLYRADAGVELLLTADPARADAIAGDLDRANRERRETEGEVLAEAERLIREDPEMAAAPALVLWGEGWHTGVVGICASRLVERHGKPVVMIALEGERGKGSGRSVPGYDLLAGMRSGAEHLRRFGGHVAAAGLEIDAGSLEAFRRCIVEHAGGEIDGDSALAGETVDAVVGAESLGHDLAEQIARLGPFGKGNPEVRLVVPSARLAQVRPMGEGGAHARFSLAGAAGSAAGVAFGVNGGLERAAEAGALDVSVALELNEWNGAVEPRVVLGAAHEQEEAGTLAPPPAPDEPEFWTRLAEEAGVPAEPAPFAEPRSRRELIDRRGESGVAVVAGLLSSGEGVLIVVADAARRFELVSAAASARRFAAAEAAVIAGRRSVSAGLDGAARVVLADWPALERDRSITERFEHVVLVDPPWSEASRSAALGGSGYAHLVWGAPELEFSRFALTLDHPLRAGLAGVFRSLRSASGGAQLTAGAAWRALAGEGLQPRSPELAARSLRVLAEIGAVAVDASGPEHGLGVVSSERFELTSSRAFCAWRTAHEECERYLNGLR